MDNELNKLHRLVHLKAGFGLIEELKKLLSKVQTLTNVKEFLDTPVVEADTKCTALVIAADNGHDNVVSLLLKNYAVDVETECGTDGFPNCGATALWFAAKSGHLNVVKTLVEGGADVNHATQTNFTPVRAACFHGRLDIVEYLVENGADISISDNANNSCLMIAAKKGHLNIVECLLNLGSDPNVRDESGGTALHYAAEEGNLRCTKTLLGHGAHLTINGVGMTPLTLAAGKTHGHVVRYLISTYYITQVEKIEALELLGATWIYDDHPEMMELGYNYLHWAMRERYKDPNNPILKKILPPIPAYDNRCECQTLEELERIEYCPNAINMEGLIIRERILSPSNPEVADAILDHGLDYAINGRFDRCLDLWLHALRLGKMMGYVLTNLLQFSRILSHMLNNGVDVPFQIFFDVLESAVQEFRNNNQNLLNTTEEDLREALRKKVDENIHIILYLLVIAAKTLKSRTKSEEESLLCIIYQLLRLQVRTSNGSTLLHLCVNIQTIEIHDVFNFPCSATTNLLVKCGADVNSKDNYGNTALHLIVRYKGVFVDFQRDIVIHEELRDIIDCLYKAGAHMDYTNKDGRTPIESAASLEAEIMLKSKTDVEMSLKCLAAKAINYHGIDYIGIVPSSSVGFIEDHWVRRKQ